MKNEDRIERVKQMVLELREMFPETGNLSLTSVDEGHASIGLHELPDYKTATRLFQSLGIGERRKQVFAQDTPWFSLEGDRDGVTVNVYGKGLPTSCKLVHRKKTIPKTKLIELADSVEIDELVVVCGEHDEVQS